MNMANNANIRAVNDNMSAINSELRQALLVTQQQVATLARSNNNTYQLPAWVPPPRGVGEYYEART